MYSLKCIVKLVIVYTVLFCISNIVIYGQDVKDSPIQSDDAKEPTSGRATTTAGGFLQAFIASISMVIVSELGDKTFFIAAIMAMKHPRIIVFSGAISALIVMTVLSAMFGWIATIVPRVYTYYASAVLFAIFGLKMLRDGWKMDPNEGLEELEEVQSELKKREDKDDKEESIEMMETGDKAVAAEAVRRRRRSLLTIFFQAATLTFLAEWGDRSQLATVVLAAREHAGGVILGGVMGHALCTGIAVLGGRMLAQRISVKTVTLIGGVVFLIFALDQCFTRSAKDADIFQGPQ